MILVYLYHYEVAELGDAHRQDIEKRNQPPSLVGDSLKTHASLSLQVQILSSYIPSVAQLGYQQLQRYKSYKSNQIICLWLDVYDEGQFDKQNKNHSYFTRDNCD